MPLPTSALLPVPPSPPVLTSVPSAGQVLASLTLLCCSVPMCPLRLLWEALPTAPPPAKLPLPAVGSHSALLCPTLTRLVVFEGRDRQSQSRAEGRCLGVSVDRLSDGPWAERLPAYCTVSYKSRSCGCSEQDGRPRFSCPSGCLRP